MSKNAIKLSPWGAPIMLWLAMVGESIAEDSIFGEVLKDVRRLFGR